MSSPTRPIVHARAARARIVSAGILAGLAMTCSAAYADTRPGSQLPYAGAGSYGRVIAATANPAAPSLGDRRLRFGILADLGVGFEIGRADNFDRHVEEIADAFEDLEHRLEALEHATPTAHGLSALIHDIVWFEDASNDLMRELGDNAYAKLQAGASGPGAPLSFRLGGGRGVVTLDYAGYVEAWVGVESAGDAFDSGLAGFDVGRLGAESSVGIGRTADGYVLLRVDPEASGDFEEFAFRPSDDAGLVVQGGVVRRLSGGYAREVHATASGVWHAGLTLNAYSVTLARSGIRLNDLDDMEDVAEDEFRNNQTRSSGLGVDAGVFWVGGRYAAGASLANLNGPSFAYPNACDNGVQTSSCRLFDANPNAKRNGDSWRMSPQLTLEGSASTDDGRWAAAARLDANSVVDSTGDSYQWLAMHGRYLPARAWVPSPRLGYKKNVSGEQLDYLMAGATFFRAFHLDAAWALASAAFDGSNVPRALQVNLGLSLNF